MVYSSAFGNFARVDSDRIRRGENRSSISPKEESPAVGTTCGNSALLISNRDRLFLKCSCTEEMGKIVWPTIRVCRALSRPTIGFRMELGKGGK